MNRLMLRLRLLHILLLLISITTILILTTYLLRHLLRLLLNTPISILQGRLNFLHTQTCPQTQRRLRRLRHAQHRIILERNNFFI